MMTLTSALAHIVRLADELARTWPRDRDVAKLRDMIHGIAAAAVAQPRVPVRRAELGRDQAPPAQLAGGRLLSLAAPKSRTAASP